MHDSRGSTAPEGECIYVSQIPSKLCYNIYITLCIGLPCEKVEGSTGSNGDCNDSFHYPPPNSLSINISFFDVITLVRRRKSLKNLGLKMNPTSQTRMSRTG